jgi:cellulose synthase/poly-beta-1,6-N-acetylglucosamine synthase-like glycosyltransferase
MVLTFLTAIYLICALLLTLYAIGAMILLVTYLRHRNNPIAVQPVSAWPTVAVQLPVYNELYVVDRLLDSVAALDYPRDRFIIQVLDDSTDETSSIVASKVAALQANGLNIQHVRRGTRAGYKAGALAHGLSLLKPMEAEMVAVFDADFVPPQDFLRRTVAPLVQDSSLAMVQARWGHLNSDDNALTMGQMLALDGHFVVEQTARNRAGWLMNFNGTGGVWRVRAIEEAGGWQDCTLTEDLDLSYRAQLKGWRFLYLSDVVVPGELPPHIAAYKQQQARWAKGGTQCMVLLLKPIWTSQRLTLMQRLMGTMHLCQYVVHPLIITMLLLTPLLLITHQLQHLPLGPLGFAGLGPPLIFIVSQRALYTDWRRRLLALPALVALGTGMSWSNASAVVSGLMGRKEEFKRTPKYAANRRTTKYSLRLNRNIIWEIGLAFYALWGAILALQLAPGFVPYLLIYTFAFGIVGVWGLREHLVMSRAAV